MTEETSVPIGALSLILDQVDEWTSVLEVVGEKEFRYIWVNNTLLNQTGFSHRSVIGKTFFDLLSPEKAQISLEACEKVVKEKKSAEWKREYSLPVGNRVLEGRYIPLKSQSGVVTHIVGVARDVSARKNAGDNADRQNVEKEARENEDKFRQVTETIQEVFWMTDPRKNQMLYISPAYERVWGRSCQSLYENPRNWLDAIHPEDRERVLAAAIQKQSIGEYDETYRIDRPDGTIRWIRDRAFPVKDAAGEVYRVTGIAQDITDQIASEEALKHSEALFRHLFDAVTDVVYVLSPQATFDLLNPAFEIVTGRKVHEWLGKPFAPLVHPDDLPHAVEIFTRQGRGEFVPPQYELRIKKLDGTYVVGEFHSGVIMDNGVVTSHIGIVRDVTQRKSEEYALMLRTKALQAAQNSVVITDNNGTILWGNDAVYTNTGYAISELLGKTPRIFKSGVHSREYYGNMWEMILSGQVWQGEIANKKKDGTIFTEEMTITPVRVGTDDITHFIAIKQDVTSKKKIEREYAMFFDLSADLMCMNDMRGKFHRVNAVSKAMLGYMPEELVGTLFLDYVHPDDKKNGRRPAVQIAKRRNSS